MNVLVVAAHPDDEILGCGGTMAKMSAEGAKVTIAILGEGITSREGNRNDSDQRDLDDLKTDAQKAANIVGAIGPKFYDLPDNRFDSVDLLDVVKIVEKLIDDTRPDIVFTQHGGDLNVDHSVVFRAVMTATRPLQDCCVKSVLSYRVASSTEWALNQFSPRFAASVFYDISQTIDAKINAMQAYRSEARSFPHPRSPESLRAEATYLGSIVGCSAAEAFTLIREVR